MVCFSEFSADGLLLVQRLLAYILLLDNYHFLPVVLLLMLTLSTAPDRRSALGSDRRAPPPNEMECVLSWQHFLLHCCTTYLLVPLMCLSFRFLFNLYSMHNTAAVILKAR